MSIDTQGMSPDEIALTAELDIEGLPPEAASEVANREALAKPNEEETDETGPNDPPAAAPAPAPAPAPPPAGVATAAPAPADPPEAAPAPANDDPGYHAPYEVDIPADADAKIKAFADEKADAFAKLMDGDMTAEAYREIEDRTNASIKAIETKVLTATVLSAANEQQAAKEWKRAESTEFSAFKGEGLDYRGKPALLAAYNVNLKALAALPENETKDARWFLREAHKLTKADLGLTSAPAAAPAAPAAAPAASRGVDRATIPPTLARTPPAVDPTVAGDEFAHMASLKGAEAERAYAAMTPEQQERYLDA